ncbi:hypothetical protein ACLMJK_001681 [Lecanora helva]
MRLWKIGRSKTGGQADCVTINKTEHLYTLHLFRALLRQSSYLPDSAARQFFHNYIVSRFRAYHPNKLFQADCNEQRLRLVQQRRPQLLTKARRGLLFLQRANDGHPRHLGKVLAMTYGRIGKRRHQLLYSLRIPDVPPEGKSTRNLSEPASQGVPRPSRQLQALIRSQAKRKLSFFSRPNRPTLEAKIPEKNAWGRSMPMKRVRNIKKSWYGQTIDRIMPPLPESEWMKLRDLASGRSPWEGPVSRRGHTQPDGFKYETVRGTLSGGTGILSHPHKITARYMKRLWTKIFAQCPLMKPDESRKFGWELTWGDISGTKDVALRPRMERNMAMFTGVDDQGRKLSAS